MVVELRHSPNAASHFLFFFFLSFFFLFLSFHGFFVGRWETLQVNTTTTVPWAQTRRMQVCGVSTGQTSGCTNYLAARGETGTGSPRSRQRGSQRRSDRSRAGERARVSNTLGEADNRRGQKERKETDKGSDTGGERGRGRRRRRRIAEKKEQEQGRDAEGKEQERELATLRGSRPQSLYRWCLFLLIGLGKRCPWAPVLSGSQGNNHGAWTRQLAAIGASTAFFFNSSCIRCALSIMRALCLF
jgi:hypothetical protein